MIVVPYAQGHLHAETVSWALSAAATLVDVGGDDHAYFRLLADLWSDLPDGEPLAVVEHDMVPDAAAWPGLWACHEPWCTQPYPISDGAARCVDCLGCVRWSGRLRAELPDLFGHIARVRVSSTPPTTWSVLDTYVKRELTVRGYRAHPHGSAGHLHKYDSQAV